MVKTTHVTYFLEDQLWSVRTVGLFLGGKDAKPLSRGAIAGLVSAGILPAPIKLGQSRRWRKSAVLAAVQKLEAQAHKIEQRRVKAAV